MIDVLPFPADFDLAQRCLEGEAEAIAELQRTFGPMIASYLVYRGASPNEAEDLTDGLWADCLAERASRRPRLANYAGKAPLQCWLKTMALNQLIKLHADERRRLEVALDDDLARRQPTEGAPPEDDPMGEAPLLSLMRTALESAFQNCAAEDFVLLQLAHTDGLRLEELARMFDCVPSTISRRLAAAQDEIAAATIRYVRQADPLIELKWEDFVELCRVASPACFGVD